ncbi:ATPase family associated with various cellular activities (AAA), putative [Trypanosoma equiperdum]|uniref:ATPase family associated with various cellular activities (AAA), putative n=1 Tax=Trypanosoma equiperdum TaxID=5694 RepID=A0A1G4I6J8_TRYEQ|nr:ATPase family associated with various cellular activities (AAA), putative [Trypanosoma equiperdum]
MQSTSAGSDFALGTSVPPFLELLPLLVILLIFAFGIQAVVLLSKSRWEDQQGNGEGEVVRTITGTFYRSSFYHRFYENSKCEHTGILLSSTLLNIARHVQNGSKQLVCTTVYPRDARHGPDKQSVLFLFDPLKSDSELVLGPSSFESTGFFYAGVALRGFNLRDQLPRYAVASLPTCGMWITVGDGIEVTYQRCRKDEDFAQRVDHVLYLKARGPGAAQKLERFVDQSLKEYISNLPRTAGGQQYHFQLTGGEKTLQFTKQLLSTSKTFDTLFFSQKDELLSRLEQFVEKKGRFAIEGFPYKLGFLVYGESGVGKTALVSAIAAYTGRHVISLHLPIISTDQQLSDIFLTRTLRCTKDFQPFVYELDDVIFLFEDVDASDDLVRCRQASTGQGPEGGNQCGYGLGGAASQQARCDGRYKVPGLSGFLNVLDGVVDMHSLIVVMTTRDPNDIDSALLRPGRFGYKIHMENMRTDELVGLVGLHFGTEQRHTAEVEGKTEGERSVNAGRNLYRLSRADEKTVREYIVSRCGEEFSINGRVAEAMCMGSDTLDEFLARLAKWYGEK